MGKISNYIGKLKQVSIDVQERMLLDVVKKHEDAITDLNTEDQLFAKGIDSEGTPLSSIDPYRPFTIQMKTVKGQPTNRVTLRDEGDFHKSFFLRTDDFPVLFDAQNWKTDKLKEKYGEQLFGLTDQNKAHAREYLKQDIQNGYRELLRPD